jgi:hypothetical protein
MLLVGERRQSRRLPQPDPQRAAASNQTEKEHLRSLLLRASARDARAPFTFIWVRALHRRDAMPPGGEVSVLGGGCGEACDQFVANLTRLDDRVND